MLCRVHEGASREASNAEQVAGLQQNTATQLTSVSEALAMDASEHARRLQGGREQLNTLAAARSSAVADQQVSLHEPDRQSSNYASQ